MAYLKPSKLMSKLLNPVALRMGMKGTVALSIVGRRSGQMRTVPVIVLSHSGGRYLVSARGETEWVRNLRAAGTAELGRGSSTESVRAVEVPAEERPPLLAAYQKKAGQAVASLFKTLPDPSDHPVFRIEGPAAP